MADHVKIGDRTQVAAKSGIIADAPPDSRLIGYPAKPGALGKRIWVTLEHLPEMRRDLKRVMDRMGMEHE